MTWLSPSFPVGAFSYSHGLEWAVHEGHVHSPDALHDWIDSLINHGSGWNDALLLAESWYAAREHDRDRLRAASALAEALAPSSERHLETMQMGTAFLESTTAWSNAVSDELVLIGYVRRAVKVVHARRDVIVLLGIEADYPETEYGWIEPCDVPLPIDGEPVFPIRRFWEKPSPPLAQQLFERGCLWNSFIMVGWVTAFLELVQATAPDVIGAFEPVRSRLGSVAEGATVERVYSELPSISFSDCVLARAPDRLVTVRVKGLTWSDLGSPERLVAALHRAGRIPSWLSQVDLARYDLGG